jgi:hypothetical protein
LKIALSEDQSGMRAKRRLYFSPVIGIFLMSGTIQDVRADAGRFARIQQGNIGFV